MNLGSDSARSMSVSIPAVLSRDSASRSSSIVGDMNGDGWKELVVCYPESSVCLVYLGNPSQQFSSMRVSFSLQGDRDAGDYFGWAVTGVGDLTGDGLEELIVSAIGSGVVYVIYGKRSFDSVVDVLSLAGGDGFRLMGGETGVNNGMAISRGGDFNGDGYEDLVVSRISATGRGQGTIDIIFGRGQWSDMWLDGLNSSLGLRLSTPQFSFAGFSVAGVGDMNGDGLGDVAIGSVPFQGRYVDQRVYVLFGRRSGGSLELSGMVEGVDGFVVVGGGFMVSGAGDVNGDGLGDVLVVSYMDWQGQGNAYLLQYPNTTITAPPSMFPSSSPSSFPSSAPSSIPSEAASTYEPSNHPSASPFPATDHPSVLLAANESFAPTIPRTMAPSRSLRPSLVPTMTTTRAPTRPPSRSPTSLAPSRSPTSLKPSVAVTVAVTRAPLSSRPTRRPFTQRPSFDPSPAPTFSPINPNQDPPTYVIPENITVISCNAASKQCNGNTGENVQFLIYGEGTIRVRSASNVAAPNNQNNNNNGDSLVSIYVIYPNYQNTIIIESFSPASDLLDISLYPEITTMEDISYATNPYTLLISANQFVVLMNLKPTDLSDRNLLLHRKKSSGNSSFLSSEYMQWVLILGVVWVVGMIFYAVHVIEQKYSKRKDSDDPYDRPHHGKDEDDEDENGHEEDKVDEEDERERRARSSNETRSSGFFPVITMRSLLTQADDDDEEEEEDEQEEEDEDEDEDQQEETRLNGDDNDRDGDDSDDVDSLGSWSLSDWDIEEDGDLEKDIEEFIGRAVSSNNINTNDFHQNHSYSLDIRDDEFDSTDNYELHTQSWDFNMYELDSNTPLPAVAAVANYNNQYGHSYSHPLSMVTTMPSYTYRNQSIFLQYPPSYSQPRRNTNPLDLTNISAAEAGNDEDIEN